MKTSVIVKIITWLLIAIFLVAVLVNVINKEDNILGFKPYFFKPNFLGYNYNNGSNYLVADGIIKVEDIRNVDIDWISGKIEVLEYDGDNIEFYEEGSSDIEEADKMRYLVEDGKLKIKFKKSTRFLSFPFSKSLNKTLIIKMPSSTKNNLNDFIVKTVSAPVEIENLVAENISINVISGSVDIKNIKSEVLDVDTISGSSNVSGAVEFVNFDATSGKIIMDLSNCPKKIKASTVSGSVNILIPENEGFTAEYDVVSGKFKCNFEVEMTKNEAVYKNGKSNFELDTVSGGININRK